MEWIPVTEKLPELDEMVWLYENGRIFIGCRSHFDNEGWLWCRADEPAEYRQALKEKFGDGWDMAPESDDDYKPTYWMPLPKPPEDL